MIFISDVQNYVHIKLCKTAGSIHLFKIIGTLKAKNIKLNKNYIWDTLAIDWKEVTVTFNGNKIDLPILVIIKLQDKIKVRRLMNREPLLFHLMFKTRNNMVHFGNRNTGNHVNIKLTSADILPKFFFTFRWHTFCNLSVTFCMASLDATYQ